MHLSNIESMHDIKECVELYKNVYEIPKDDAIAIANLTYAVKRKKFVKLLREDSGGIVAWIFADIATLLHSKSLIFQQQYYASDLEGYRAVKALQLLHTEMYTASIHTKADFCISTCSPTDSRQVLSRSLEKLGWIRHGHVALKSIDRFAR